MNSLKNAYFHWIFNATFVRSSVCDVFATNGSKNMGEGRAEPRTVYPLLYEGEGEARKRSIPEALPVARRSNLFKYLNTRIIIVYTIQFFKTKVLGTIYHTRRIFL